MRSLDADEVPGKYKAKRGGGRSFSRNLTLDENGTAVSTDKRGRRAGEADDDEDEDDDEEEEEEEDDDEEEEEEEGEEGEAKPELSRAERRELKRKQAAAKNPGEEPQAAGEEGGTNAEDDLLINPNRAAKKLTISDLSAPRELSRREREQKEKQEAKDRYWKLHVQGKTDQAKADLSRLAKIRAEREAAQAKRKAETDAKAKEIEAAKAVQSGRRS
ncbi:casein kinase substrate phosphoprotein PP28-domain-containing protein [Gloeopeniophorella convolvens]|nr:casein kinase substrate phosphoprotein PP28-domain-containing protein [Gloeopeniophorella convolvens]